MNNATTTAPRQRIIARTSPCRCGCVGRDPWHRADFTRTIKDVQFGNSAVTQNWDGTINMIENVLLGTAQFPWGKAAVSKTAYQLECGKWLTGGWCLVEAVS